MCHKTKPGDNYLRKGRQCRKKSQNRVYMIAKKYLGRTIGILSVGYWRKRYKKNIGGMMANEKDEGVM